MAPNPTDLKQLRLRLARDRRRSDMAQMDDWEHEMKHFRALRRRETAIALLVLVCALLIAWLAFGSAVSVDRP